MIIVIADDITGAAEIAGTAWRFGLKVILSTDFIKPDPDIDVYVIATDTRSGNEADAINETRRLASLLKDFNGTLFKKIDSVLRGHIVAELNVLLESMKFKNVLLLPQNPSKGRIIDNGMYYIDGMPLAKTAFKNDPEFPVKSSSIKEILGNDVSLLQITDNLSENVKRIYIAEASTQAHIATQLNKTTANTLIAGGADLFNVMLQQKFTHKHTCHVSEKIEPSDYSIIVCGSTQSEDITKRDFFKNSKTYNAIIPENVFNGMPAKTWLQSLPDIYKQHKSIAITIGQKENGGPLCAARLRDIMAQAVYELYITHEPKLLIIEGGATAYSILKRLHWNELTIKMEYGQGIVSMTHGNTEIVLKPGSYPWNNLL